MHAVFSTHVGQAPRLLHAPGRAAQSVPRMGSVQDWSPGQIPPASLRATAAAVASASAAAAAALSTRRRKTRASRRFHRAENGHIAATRTTASLKDDADLVSSSSASSSSTTRLTSEATGAFPFPETDLPWPPEHIRILAPSESPQRPRLQAPGGSEHWLKMFRSAAPYIAAFRGATVVVHLPSFLLERTRTEAFKGIMEDVAFCTLLGLKIVLVQAIGQPGPRRRMPAKSSSGHGGGDDSSAGWIAPDLFPMDEEALRSAKQEAGYARVEVESALGSGFQKRERGAPAGSASAGIFATRGAISAVSSLSFYSAGPLGVIDGVNMGCAGTVRSINTDLIERRLGESDIVLLTPLGASPSGQVFMVDSEELAAMVATKLGAMKLVYFTHGARLADERAGGGVIAGVQVNNAAAFFSHLADGGWAAYPPDVRASSWFQQIARLLPHVVKAVSPRGVRRGHFVDPEPGALLQEFYTTDGSGTCIAQDLYQGLGRCSPADAARIVSLLAAELAAGGFGISGDGGKLPQALREEVETACANGEFFVWRRDDVVLGCGQLLRHRSEAEVVAELRHFAIAHEEFASEAQALALFGYAERAAIRGGAAALALRADGRLERESWFPALPLRAARAEELPASLRNFSAEKESGQVYLKRLDEASAAEAEAWQKAFVEEERMWGGVS